VAGLLGKGPVTCSRDVVILPDISLNEVDKVDLLKISEKAGLYIIWLFF
jgi:hypothetical protein